MTARTLTADEAWRWDRTADPRATDYPEDTQQWLWLLTKVYDRSDASDELLGALNYVRCQGARIIPAPNAMRSSRSRRVRTRSDTVRPRLESTSQR
jgi:hypothetical protein